MCALWFHQTVKGRLPKYGKYRNITPYPCSPKIDRHEGTSQANRHREVDSALPLYYTPVPSGQPGEQEKKILGLVSIHPPIERGHLRSLNLNDGISVPYAANNAGTAPERFRAGRFE